ncbi:MAG: tetratricopeptide repeat protein [Kiritimatiellae bacterium]|nr:tetratricopeptide repeat protein [Kiritimatiellia bacterium]
MPACAVLLVLALAGCGRLPGESLFLRGQKELARGKLVRANQLFEKAARENPTDAVIQNYLGYTYWKLAKPDLAREAFEKSRRFNDALPDSAYNLGVVLAHQGQTAEATNLLLEAARLAPTDWRPPAYLGYVHERRKRWGEALEAYECARELAPDSPAVATAIANCLYRQGKLDDAHDALMAVLEKEPAYAPALYNLAVIYRDGLKRNGQAAMYLERYLEAAGKDPHVKNARVALQALRPPSEPPPARPPATTPAEPAPAPQPPRRPAEPATEPAPVQAADTAPRTATPAPDPTPASRPAEPAARERSEPAPTPQPPRESDPSRAERSSFAQAQAAIGREDYDVALIALKRIVSSNPHYADPLWELALLYDRHLDNPGKARETYRDFADQFPGDARAADARARSAAAPADEGRPARPETSRTARDPQAALENFKRGRFYQEHNRLTRAIQYYVKALENDDTFAPAYYNLGVAYRSRGDLALARDAYQAALRIQPDMTNARYNLALVFRDLSDPENAKTHLKYVLRAAPDYAPGHFALAQIYADNEDTFAVARAHYQSYLRLAPNGPYAPRARRWLSLYGNR